MVLNHKTFAKYNSSEETIQRLFLNCEYFSEIAHIVKYTKMIIDQYMIPSFHLRF